MFALVRAAAESYLPILAIWCDDVHDQSGAGVEVPELVRADAMEGGELIAREQEVDGGGGGAVSTVAGKR